MRVQQTLSFVSPSPIRPPAVPVRTSIAAAEAIAEMAGTLRGQVYDYLVERGSQGATRQEISDALRMKLQTVCGRMGELKALHLVWEGEDIRDGRKVIRVRTKF
jgi:hypothetical protein